MRTYIIIEEETRQLSTNKINSKICVNKYYTWVGIWLVQVFITIIYGST